MYTPSLTERPRLDYRKPALNRQQVAGFIASESNRGVAGKDLTVVVVAYNEREQLLTLLNAILAQSKSRAGVILVDNGLDAGIKQAVAQLPIHYVLASENYGCSEGRNIGGALVTTPLTAFVDADAEIKSDYIDQCLAAMADSNVVCARGRVLPITAGSLLPKHYDLGDAVMQMYPDAEGISVWRTDAYQQSGGFDADLYGGEGRVLWFRMTRLLGYRPDQFIYFPSLLLLHDFNNDPAHLASKDMRNRINRWSIDLRYPLLWGASKPYVAAAHQREVERGSATTHDAHLDALVAESETAFNAAIAQYHHDRAAARWLTPDLPRADGKYNFAVVLPCFNLGAYLEKAIGSLFRQSLDHIQIIVVDDVSPDAQTQEVLDRLSSAVTVIRRDQNGGASAARNTGIAAANADLILCLDADDWIGDTYLEQAFSIFSMHPEIDVVAPYVKISGERKGVWKPAANQSLAEMLLGAPIPNASCYRKSVWEATGGYDEQLRGYEDWEFWINVFKRGSRYAVLNRFHYFYLTRPDGKVKTSNKNSVDITTHIINRHREVFEANVDVVVSTLLRENRKLTRQVGDYQADPRLKQPDYHGSWGRISWLRWTLRQPGGRAEIGRMLLAKVSGGRLAR